MTERTISKVLIAREDLALGQGQVAQTRQGVSTSVSQIDLPWVVTQLTSLQQLDTTKYFHTILDTSTDTLLYKYNASSSETVDNYNYVAPAVGSGQWVLVHDFLNPLTSVEYHNSLQEFVLTSPNSRIQSVIINAYYSGWESSVIGPIGKHRRHRTGGTAASPTPGGTATAGTIGTGTYAGYCYTADGAEWVISEKRGNVLFFGAKDDNSTDNGNYIRDAAKFIANAGGGEVYFPKTNTGVYKFSGTLYFYGNDVKFKGDSTDVQLDKTTTGTCIAADPDSQTVAVYTTRTRCTIEDLYITSSNGSATIGIDLTGFAYSHFNQFEIYIPGNNKKLIYGIGNQGSSPYYNTISNFSLFGNNNGSSSTGSVGFAFEEGAHTGGSNGPNANMIFGCKRAASLDYYCDLQAGNGNIFNQLSIESIHQCAFRLNYQASASATGTSTGSNTQNTINDTGASLGTNTYLNGGIKITSGTGAGQVRMIKNHTATQVTVVETWSTIPDNTSVYEIYKGKGIKNQLSNIRLEGLASSNPDFIQAYPGCNGTEFTKCEVQSLGSGNYVVDTSGAADNKWYTESLVIMSANVTNPGPSANIDVYNKNSVFGGVAVAGKYALQWMRVAITTSSLGDTCDVRLDVSGATAGSGDATLHAAIIDGQNQATVLPNSTDRTLFEGSGKALFLNVQTGASFSGTADMVITFCIELT